MHLHLTRYEVCLLHDALADAILRASLAGTLSPAEIAAMETLGRNLRAALECDLATVRH